MEGSLILFPSEVFCGGLETLICTLVNTKFEDKFVEGEVPFQLASLKQQRKNNVAAPLSFLSLLALYFSLFSKGGRVK